MEVRDTLQDKIRPLLDELETDAEISFGSILEKLFEGILFLRNSEKLLILAIEHSEGEGVDSPIPKSGRAEAGWLPYLFKHAADENSKDPIILAFQDMLTDVFHDSAPTVEKILHVFGDVLMSQLTQQQWQYLETHLHGHDIIANDGTIVGNSVYEDFDTNWLYAFANYFLNLLYPSGIAAFVPDGTKAPCKVQIGKGQKKISIAVIGDWGTGAYVADGSYDPASLVMQTLEKLDPDYVIHLGDVYYAGTDDRLPPGEESKNFLKMWPASFNGRSFTLNSNHEMYGGAQGYFDIALNRPDTTQSPFSMQNGYSFFALEFGPWVLVGIDAAYHDPSFLYMQGGIGSEDTNGNDAQLQFLKQVAAQYPGKKFIVFSHQTGMSTDGTAIEEDGKLQYPLLSQLQQTGITPDYWYWGHVHLGLVYGKQSAITRATGGRTLARCVGHSAIPIGAPWGLTDGNDVIEYIARTGLQNSHLVLNGLALLTLHNDGTIQEQFYDCANAQGKVENDPQPSWHN